MLQRQYAPVRNATASARSALVLVAPSPEAVTVRWVSADQTDTRGAARSGARTRAASPAKPALDHLKSQNRQCGAWPACLRSICLRHNLRSLLRSAGTYGIILPGQVEYLVLQHARLRTDWQSGVSGPDPWAVGNYPGVFLAPTTVQIAVASSLLDRSVREASFLSGGSSVKQLPADSVEPAR